jgi:hypothetical protein
MTLCRFNAHCSHSFRKPIRTRQTLFRPHPSAARQRQRQRQRACGKQLLPPDFTRRYQLPAPTPPSGTVPHGTLARALGRVEQPRRAHAVQRRRHRHGSGSGSGSDAASGNGARGILPVRPSASQYGGRRRRCKVMYVGYYMTRVTSKHAAAWARRRAISSVAQRWYILGGGVEQVKTDVDVVCCGGLGGGDDTIRDVTSEHVNVHLPCFSVEARFGHSRSETLLPGTKTAVAPSLLLHLSPPSLPHCRKRSSRT